MQLEIRKRSATILATSVATSVLFALPASFAMAGGFVEVDPFVGDHSEGFESYETGFTDDPFTICGGETLIIGAERGTVYEPAVEGFSLGTSGYAQTNSGDKGWGNANFSFITDNFIVDFLNDDIITFGAWWGATTNGDAKNPGPSTITFEFLDPAGDVIGVDTLDYSAPDLDGELIWKGWEFDQVLGGVRVTGWRVVMDDLQKGLIPSPGALALLGLAGLVGGRRRRHTGETG